MFDNIGGKIKSLAQVVCWIGIIVSVIAGIAMMSTDEDLALGGFVIIVVGSLVSWVSSFTLYGFGQLIENTDYIAMGKERPNSQTPPKNNAIHTQSELMDGIKRYNRNKFF